jgi:transposase
VWALSKRCRRSAVVDASSQPVATIRVPVSSDGYRALRRFADRWPDPTWAIEGASGLGAPLTAPLRTDGIDVVDVPAKLAARVRMLSTGHGRKKDDADAASVGIAARSARRLNSAAVEGTVTALRAIIGHRDDLVKTRGGSVVQRSQLKPRTLTLRTITSRTHQQPPYNRRTQVS